MKIQYCSDLHLEFEVNKKYLNQNPILPVGEILILAGDIVPFVLIEKHQDFFDWISDNFKYTYWIPGNHEYYYFDAATRTGLLNENIRANVSLVNDVAIQYNDMKLILSTLWSKISARNAWEIENGMSDFQVIKYNNSRFTANEFNALHQASLNFINSELSSNDNTKSIIITHHVPTLYNYPKQYKGSSLQEGFAVELFYLIEESNAAAWIYGHHHSNTPDFTIGNTQMLTNQLGYVSYKEHLDFKNNKVFEFSEPLDK